MGGEGRGPRERVSRPESLVPTTSDGVAGSHVMVSLVMTMRVTESLAVHSTTDPLDERDTTADALAE